MLRDTENLSALAIEIMEGSQKLAGQQAALLKAEWTEEWQKTKRVLFFAAGSTLVATALSVLISLTLVQVAAHYTSLPLWGCYWLVTSGVGAFGGLLLWYARFHLE